jgi:hypothetical protein
MQRVYTAPWNVSIWSTQTIYVLKQRTQSVQSCAIQTVAADTNSLL